MGHERLHQDIAGKLQESIRNAPKFDDTDIKETDMQNLSTEVVTMDSQPFVILDPRSLDARKKPFIASAERLKAIGKGDSVKVLAVWLGAGCILRSVDEWWLSVLSANNECLEVKVVKHRVDWPEIRFERVIKLPKDIVTDVRSAQDGKPRTSKKIRPGSLFCGRPRRAKSG